MMKSTKTHKMRARHLHVGLVIETSRGERSVRTNTETRRGQRRITFAGRDEVMLCNPDDHFEVVQ
jgi:hypothetical protein